MNPLLKVRPSPPSGALPPCCAVSGSTMLTVTAAVLQTISVTPVNPIIAKGTTKQFVATGTYSDGTTQNLTGSATWASTQPSVAIVDNTGGNKGFATGTGVGPTTISANIGVVRGSTNLTVTAATLVSIAVTPGTPSIANGTTAQFTATGTYSDATTQNITSQVAWVSNRPNVAAISNAPASNEESRSTHDFLARAASSDIGRMSHPTLDHYLPLLYAAAVADPTDPIAFPISGFDLGSLSMRSVIWGFA